MPEVHGIVSYPGVVGAMGFSATFSHGLTPSAIILRCQPQVTLPAQTGDITISDSNQTVVIRKCRLNQIRQESSEGGFEWILELVDRRWKWRDIGYMEGWYNQLDPHAKLIPYTIKSPYELAQLCLDRMGESGYIIDLPFGLDSSVGKDLSGFLSAGMNFPPTGTNPCQNWQGDSPAQVLSRLCDAFGRRIVFDPISDTVSILKLGVGSLLPDGWSINQDGPSVKSPETPDGIMVYGAPTKYQARFRLEPVGLEWDESYRPINELSYTPEIPGQTQATTWTITLPPTGQRTDVICQFRLRFKKDLNEIKFRDDNIIEIGYSHNLSDADDEEDVLGFIKDQFDLNPISKAKVTITVVGSPGTATMTVQSIVAGESFDVVLHGFNIDPSEQAVSTIAITRIAQPGGRGWDYTQPPIFENVKETDRLNKSQARRLAQQSVWKMYRIVNVDISGKEGPVKVPGYYKNIDRIQQIVLSETKVDQIVPNVGDATTRDPITGQPIIREWYNGYSKDQPAMVYGSVYKYYANILWALPKEDENTPLGSRVPYEFSVNPTWSMITFSNHVFFYDVGGRYKTPNLVLETGCLMRDPDTNQLEVYKAIRMFPTAVPNGTDLKTYKHQDVQLNITSTYDEKGNVTGWELLEDDAVNRANYYLDAHSLEFFLSNAQSRRYNGLVPIVLDGAICQVSWRIDGSDCSTQASRNTEHAYWLPPYPERRRAEVLAPVLQNGNGNPPVLSRESMADGRRM